MLKSTSAGNMTALSCLMKSKIFVFTFLFSLVRNLPLTVRYNHKTSTKTFKETPLWNVGVHVSRKYDCTELSKAKLQREGVFSSSIYCQRHFINEKVGNPRN